MGSTGKPGSSETKPLNLLGFTYPDFLRRFRNHTGRGEYFARPLYRQAFVNGIAAPESLDAFRFSPRILEAAHRHFEIRTLKPVRTQCSGGVEKMLLHTRDGLPVESVIIPMPGYDTLCVSCQSGCAMGCVFCRTGRMGLLRSLSPGEIVSQLFIARFVRGRPVRNVVFMGMGEPFHNFEAVARSLDILTDSHGFNLKRTRVTVSTCGLVDPLVVFLQNHARKALLALSLNAARDALRDRLMPVNRAHGLARLKQTLLRHHPTDRPLFVEYVLIDRVNDTARDVRELAAFCSGLPVRVNLIPLNATARGTTFRPSPPRRVDSFYKRLCETGLHVIKRKSRGEEIRAACGQLGSGSDLHREGERTDAPDQGEGIRAAVKTSVRRSPPRSNSTSFSSPTRNTGPESKK